MLNPKQHNIATGPQGQRWPDDMIEADERWENQAERDLGPAYRADVAKTHAGESSHYYPGQGGPGTQSQGKLFHDPKPIDPHRWPRGYTPERQSDVAETFPDSTRPHPTLTPEAAGVPGRARDTIARSSMPTADLERLRGGEFGSYSVALQAGTGNERWGGVWRSAMNGGDDVQSRRGTIGLQADAKDHTVLHEVGHAMSTVRGTARKPTLHGAFEATDKETGEVHYMPTAQMDSEAGRHGAEEARADIYGTTHAREKSGLPATWTRDYDGNAGYPSVVNSGETEIAFSTAYRGEHERQGVERPAEVGKRLEAEKRQAARSAALGTPKPSPHLFQRPGKYESRDHPMPTEPDYGQYGAQTPEGEDVGTIPVSGGLPKDISDSVLRRQRQTDRIRKERGL